MNLETNLPNEMAWGLAHCGSSGHSCPGSRSYGQGKSLEPEGLSSQPLLYPPPWLQPATQNHVKFRGSPPFLSLSLSFPLSLYPSLLLSFPLSLPTSKFTQSPIIPPLLTFIPVLELPVDFHFPFPVFLEQGLGLLYQDTFGVRQCWFQNLLNK